MNRTLSRFRSTDRCVPHTRGDEPVEDDAAAHERTLQRDQVLHENKTKQLGMLEGGRNSRSAASNAARLKAAEMRAGGGLLDMTPKAQSSQGKLLQDMINLGLAENAQDAQMKLERSGAMKEIMKNPMLANDPKRVAEAINAWESSMGYNNNRVDPAGPDFIFNPKTGKLEPSR